MLEQAIGELNQRIEAKKITIGHLFEYEEKDENFLRVSNDRIIAETDNEYSNSNIDGPKPSQVVSIHRKKTSELSKLSLNSNGQKP